MSARLAESERRRQIADQRIEQLERELETLRRAAAEAEQALALALSGRLPAPSVEAELLRAELGIARRAEARLRRTPPDGGAVEAQRLSEALARLRANSVAQPPERPAPPPPTRVGRLRRWISAAQSG
jgi:hypothetical protein